MSSARLPSYRPMPELGQAEIDGLQKGGYSGTDDILSILAAGVAVDGHPGDRPSGQMVEFDADHQPMAVISICV